MSEGEKEEGWTREARWRLRKEGDEKEGKTAETKEREER